MAILTYRSVKESALTYDEMDDNFRYFKENPELNSIKISVKDNLDDIASLPIGSITGGLNWNIDDNAEEPNTDFRLFVKTTDTLWDPIVTQGTVVEVNTATADIKGIVKVGPSLTIDDAGLLEVDKFTDTSIATTNGEIKYLQTDGTELSWTTVDALPSQTGEQDKFLTTDGTDGGASWATVDALPLRTGEQGKILHVNSSSEAEWTNTLDRYTKLAVNPSFADETTQIATTAMVQGRIETLKNTLATNSKSSNIGNFLRVANTTDSNGNYEHEWSNTLPFNVRITTQPADNDNSDKVATTGFVKHWIDLLVGTAAADFDSFQEVFAALGSDVNAYTTLKGMIDGIGATQHHHNMMPHSTQPLIRSNNNLTFQYLNSSQAASIQLWTTQANSDSSDQNAATTRFVKNVIENIDTLPTGGSTGQYLKWATGNTGTWATLSNDYVPTSGNSTISGTLTATDFILTSDRRLKSNIKDLETESVPLLKVINPVTFNNGDIGFIAQDFENRVPELVNTTDDGYLALKYSKITAILWKQNQELLKRIETLENK